MSNLVIHLDNEDTITIPGAGRLVDVVTNLVAGGHKVAAVCGATGLNVRLSPAEIRSVEEVPQ